MSVAGDNQSAPVNPFAQHTVQDAHDDLVDVESLYEGSRSALRRADKRVRLGRSHLSVILGDVGSGKSHLLWWLRRRLISDGVYVPVGALPDLGQPFRYTLRQLLSTLCRKDPSPDAGKAGERAPFERPIDRLLWDVLLHQACDLLDAARIGTYQAPAALLKLVGPLCQELGKPRKPPEFAAAATPVWAQVEPGLRAYLLSLPTENSIDSAARAVILQYPYADRRVLVTAWLAGEDLSAKDRERIGAKQSINNEAAARYVLCSLCRLLSAALPGPLVLAYDHMDATGEQHAQPGLQGQAEVIAALQSQGGALLQVVSCRPQTWALLHEKPARPSPAQAQAQALAALQLKQVDDLLKLERPELASLRELIQARLTALPPQTRNTLQLGDRDLDPALWPAEVGTPRAALQYYAQRIQPTKAAPSEVAAAKPASKPLAKPATDTAPATKPASKPSNDDATLAVPASVLAALAKAAIPDGTSGAAIKLPAEVKAAAESKAPAGSAAAKSPPPAAAGKAATSPAAASAKDAPSKPGTGSSRRDAPSQSGDKLAPAGTARDADSKPGAGSAAKPASTPAKAASPAAVAGTNPTKPPAAAASGGRRDAPSQVPVQSQTAASSPSPSKDAGLSDSLLTAVAPSAQSPSVTWMAMAGDDDPLAKAIAEAEAELKPASPAKAKPTAKPVPATVAVKPRSTPVVTVNQGALRKPETSKPPAASRAAGDGDGDMTLMTPAGPPSSQSPSVTWMAMASGDDLLAAAIADAEADLGISKPKATKPAAATSAQPAKAAAKPAAAAAAKPAASSESPSMAWMNMGSSDGLISPIGGREAAGGAAPRGRSTLEKLPPVASRPAGGLSPEQVLSALGNRSTVEEALLANELGVAPSALAAPLSRLEDRGAVRVVAMAGGKRVISKL